MLVALILATIVDLSLAALLLAVSGLIFGDGPEDLHGEFWSALYWWIGLALCLVAPVVGFAARRRGRTNLGVLIGLLPPVAGLCFLAV
jgi:hypothetical protein